MTCGGSDSVGFDARLRSRIEEVHSAVKYLGGQLVSAHLADCYGQEFDEQMIVPRDKAWAKHCDLFVALLPLDQSGKPYRTDGTHIEIGLAIAYGKRVLVVIEGRHLPQQSYFLRNIDRLPDVHVVDWSVFFDNARLPLEMEFLGIQGDLPRPRAGCVCREQTTDPEEVLARLALQTSTESIDVRGRVIQVLPGVFSPRFSHSPDYMMQNWVIPSSARILDLGCGSGILGLFALLDGGGSLVAVDNNPAAVENTRLNLAEFGLNDRSKAFESDVDGAVPDSDRFDVVLLMPPYWDRPAPNPLAGACYDPGYRFMRVAVEAIQRRMARKGHAFIVFSDQGDVGLLTRLILTQGLRIDRLSVQRPTMLGGHVRVFYDVTLGH